MKPTTALAMLARYNDERTPFGLGVTKPMVFWFNQDFKPLHKRLFALLTIQEAKRN